MYMYVLHLVRSKILLIVMAMCFQGVEFYEIPYIFEVVDVFYFINSFTPTIFV